MLYYLLKFSACLAVFMLFYKIFLERTSAHTFKRFYLIAIVLISSGIPFITFIEYIEPQPINSYAVSNFEVTYISETTEASFQDYLPHLLWSIYALGVIIFSFRFIKNLFQIFHKINQNVKIKNENVYHVLLDELVNPHTFFRYIFFNKKNYEHNKIPKEVLVHEQTHATQMHALDILFIEILQILFWFNPLLHFIKKDIKLNHEFLADLAVINSGFDTKKYQELLLTFSSNVVNSPLANAINYSLIKKRFTIMKTRTSKRILWIRSLLILPILAVLIYGFSENKVVEKPYVFQQQIEGTGVTESLMTEYKDFINTFESLNSISYSGYQRALAIYNLMSAEQRKSVKKIPENIIPNLSDIKPITPTETTFNSWKDSNKFAIWIDEKHVKNSELENYNVSDIKYFISSFIYNNARSDKFPQPYQNHLYTKKGFDTIFINSKKDNSALEQIKKELKQGPTKTNYSKNKRNDSLINDIHIFINQKNQILLNDKLTDIDNLLDDINKLNPNLTIDQKRKFLWGKIVHQKGTSNDLIRNIQDILRTANVWSIATLNNEIAKEKALKTDRPNLPLISKEELTKEDIILYEHQLKKFKEWLRLNKPNRTLEETENGYLIKNEEGKITFSSDPEIKAEPFEIKKDSPWKINSVETVYEDSDNGMKQTTTSDHTTLNKENDFNAAIQTSELVIDADTLSELKDFNWNGLKEIFASNRQDTKIRLEFNYDNKVFIGDTESNNFHFAIEGKTSELESMIETSKKVISKLKQI